MQNGKRRMTRKSNLGQPSPSVPQTLTQIKRLQTDQRYRNATGLFFVEGVRNFVQAVDNHFEITLIIYSERLLIAPLARKFVRRLRRGSIPTVKVSPEEFRTISHTPRASGVGAIVKQKWANLDTVLPQANLCWIVLDQVRSDGNLGTLVRTSEAIGGAGFVLLNNGVDPYDPTVIRASMGAVFRQQFIRTDHRKLKRWLKHTSYSVIGASPDGNHNFQQFAYPHSVFLMLGEERQGLTDEQREMCDYLVHIPMVGGADSLNLGVAGSLLMYEVYRSRG